MLHAYGAVETGEINDIPSAYETSLDQEDAVTSKSSIRARQRPRWPSVCGLRVSSPRLVVFTGAIILIMGVTLSSFLSTNSMQTKTVESPSTLGTASSEAFRVEITMQDFLRFKPVQEFVDAQPGNMSQYLPEKIVVRGSPDLIMGSVDDGESYNIGPQAMTGYMFWSMQHKNSSGFYTAAYTVVMDLRGNIVFISPTFSAIKHGYHFITLKVYPADPNYLIGGVDIAQTQDGPIYLWNYNRSRSESVDSSEPKEWIPLCGDATVGIHDIALAYDEAGLWLTHDKGFALYDISSGSILENHQFDDVYDVNHVQVLDYDSTVILSSRDTSSFIKVNMTSGDEVWVCGGRFGTMELIDEFGIKWPAGTSLWNGQHNVEYIGDQSYAVFDDGSNMTLSSSIHNQVLEASRLLIVQVNEEKNSAQIIWTYDLGAYTPYFGDNDRLPTGNMLGTMWVKGIKTPSMDYQARIVEITRGSKEIAWEMSIFGSDEEKPLKESDGWSIYSSDRFYESPLVFGVTCNPRQLSFDVVSSFREYSTYPGNYSVLDARGRIHATGNFNFRPVWEPTRVSVNFTGEEWGVTLCDGMLVVSNRHGQTRMVSF